MSLGSNALGSGACSNRRSAQADRQCYDLPLVQKSFTVNERRGMTDEVLLGCCVSFDVFLSFAGLSVMTARLGKELSVTTCTMMWCICL